MRRVLMLAYWAPPCRRWPTASRRLAYLARHLPTFGWHPTIVAPDLGTFGLCDCGAKHDDAAPQGLDVVRVPLRPAVGLRPRPATAQQTGPGGGMLAVARSLVEVRGPWARTSTRVARALAGDSPVDALWTTSGPQESILAGRRVSRRLRCPWVADLRDPISVPVLPPHADHRPLRLLRAILYRPLLQSADAVIAASEAAANIDAAWLGRDVDTVLSGIPELVPDLEGPRQSSGAGPFRITFAGSLYPGLVEPDVFLEGIARFTADRPDVPIEIRYVGPQGDFFRDCAERAGVVAISRIDPPVPSEDVPGLLAASDALVLVETTGPRGRGRIPGKLYEYLGTGRPIISAPSRSPAIAEILQRTGAGIAARTAEDVRAAVDQLVGELDTPSGRSTPEALSPFTARAQSERLASILDRVAGP